MNLETLLKELDVHLTRKELLLPVSGISCHSKQVRPGDLFVAVKGATADGKAYIPEAMARGAKVIVSEEDFPSDPRIVKVIVKDSRKAIALISHHFYGRPSEKLRLIGITGTNGKTTVAYLTESCLREGGYSVGVIGTISHRMGERVLPAQNTTPGPTELQFLLSQMVQSQTRYAVMEVSSHALDQKRVEGIRFQIALFTNLGHDHLDYHKTQEDYFLAKRRLFESLDREAVAILNADSPYSARIREVTSSRCLTYGLHNKADFSVAALEISQEGLAFEAVTPGGRFPVHSSFMGTHNVYNLLGAIAIGFSEEIPFSTLQEGIFRLKEVPGRLERIEAGQPFHLFVDFAHTEEALREVLLSLRSFTRGRLLVVFGCGGDRDRLKRPRMAETVANFSDWAMVTSDNPRTEDPRKILQEIAAGFPSSFSYLLEEDRAKAIERTLLLARAGDTVLIAGKGHEAYQIFRERTAPFDDRKVAYDILSHSRNSESHGRILSSKGGF